MNCFYCGEALDGRVPQRGLILPKNHATKDHIIPRTTLEQHGMKGMLNNTVNACLRCNNEKGSFSLAEYRVVLAFRSGMLAVPDLLFHGETLDELWVEQLLNAALTTGGQHVHECA
jgi:hypothetical protein